MAALLFDWKRFWYPRGEVILLTGDGFLFDPESESGARLNAHVLAFDYIPPKPCLVLLGEPGIGKTTAIDRDRADTDATTRLEGDVSRSWNLNAYQSDSLLVRSVFEDPSFTAWRDGAGILHLFLDSLDECLIRINTLAALLGQELARCPTERLRLRIACRTAVWPTLLETQLTQLWGEDGVGVYELAPLRQKDVAAAATARGIDAAAFLAEVNQREAAALASKPVTLRFLLDTYQRDGAFPESQAELYRQGCELLCEEVSESRRAAQQVGALAPRQRLQVAARIAALSVFCGRPTIWTGVTADAPDGDLLLADLLGGVEPIDGQVVNVTDAAVREVLDTGLFSARGQQRLGFRHQTYAEFLAALYLHLRGMQTGQMLSLVGHPGDEEGRIVPQLQEAAAWLGSLVPAVYERIVECDPQVLLSSDVATMSPAAWERLVGSLLRLLDAGTVNDSNWDLRSKYYKLAHPRLQWQLEPFIRDRAKNRIVRRVAIDVAEACRLQELQGLLADLALDLGEDQHIREQAAYALMRIADAATLRRLRPCVTGQVGEDPQDELKGIALRALWPDHLTVEEMFAALTPTKDPSFGGAYQSFLSGPLLELLPASALPVALRWAAAQPVWDDPDYTFWKLVPDVLRAAWSRLEDPEVLDPFAEAVGLRLAEYSPVPGLEQTGESAITDAQRRRVCEAITPRWVERKKDAAALAHTQTPLLLPCDLAWLIERLKQATEAAHQGFWLRAVLGVFRIEHPGHVDSVLEAMPGCPTLQAAFGPLFATVELDSPQADAMRTEYRKWQQLLERGRPKEELLDPPPQQRVATVLNRAEANDLDAWWQLNLELTLKPTSKRYADEIESDITTLPGWEAADGATRRRIVAAAKQYVTEAQPKPADWLATGSIPRPELAGYRAMRLLADEEPTTLQSLPAEVWRKWAAIIVAYPTPSGVHGEEVHQAFVGEAYRHAPKEVTRALLTVIDKENRSLDHIFILRKAELCWDAAFATALAAKARDPGLKPSCMGSLLEALLHHAEQEGVDLATSLVPVPLPGDGEARCRAVTSAALVLALAADRAWPVVWKAIQSDSAFGRDVIVEVAGRYDQTNAAMMTQRLSEAQIGDFYLWLVQQFPPSEDPQHKGAYLMGPRDSAAGFRDAVLQQLQHRGTPAARQAVERLAAALPELSWLRWSVVATREHTLRQTWTPPRPDVLLKMACDRDLRLVESEEHLLAVVIESLRRLEQELQGENPAAPDLWNKLGEGAYRPKDENDLSNYIARHLRRDIQKRGIVANREVEIRRGEGDAHGERTDIKIDAVAPGGHLNEYGRVTVIIEVKGCWNGGLKRDMKGQLSDRYLAENQCRHGLYLVGWFLCAQWDADDDRKKHTPQMTVQEAQQFFDGQATGVSQGDLQIRAVVLDAALR